MVERVPGNQRARGSNPALGKKNSGYEIFTASKFATIVWPEDDKTSQSTSVLDRRQVESGIGKKKYFHNITQVVKEKCDVKIINERSIPTGGQP